MERNVLKTGIQKLTLDREKRELLFLSFLAVLLLFGANSTLEYATDTYATFRHAQWRHMLFDNGRLVNGAVYYLFEQVLNLSHEAVYGISFCTAILFSALAVYLVSCRTEKLGLDRYCAVAVSAGFVVNLFSVEYFLFLEKGLFLFGIFLTALAFECTARYFETDERKQLAFSALLLILAVNVYQALPGMYVVLCLPLIVMYGRDRKGFVRNNLIVAGLYGIAMAFSLVLMMIVFASNRVEESVSLISACVTTVKQIRNYFLYSGYVAPPLVLALETAIPFAALCIAAVVRKKPLLLFYAVYVTAGVTVVAFFPYFAGVSDDYTPRILYPFAALPAVLLVTLLANTGGIHWRCIWKLVLRGALLLAFLIQMGSFQQLFVERYKCNQADRVYCEWVLTQIDAYEERTGNTVSRICVYQDAHMDWGVPELNSSGLIFSSFETEWSDVSALSLYGGRKFKRSAPNGEYREIFSQKDWNRLDAEQLVFEEDTLHLCIY